MMTARFASGSARLMKETVLRLTCCAVLAAALLSSPMQEVKAAGEGVDPNFVADVRGSARVNAVTDYGDGAIIIGGTFTRVRGETRKRVAMLNRDGSLAPALATDVDGVVNAVVVQSFDKILVGGDFTTVDGATRRRVARLHVGGTPDLSFQDPGVDFEVLAVYLQADGKILIGGRFTTVGGVARSRVARLNEDGTLDTSFSNPGADDEVRAIKVDGEGKILIAGRFTTVGGMARNCVARLNPDGSLDASFEALVNGSSVNSVVVQFDQKIIIGGLFFVVGGEGRNHVARLNPDGSLDASFVNPELADGSVNSVVVQFDQKIIVGGDFRRVGKSGGPQTPRDGLARLNPDGTYDASFTPVLDRATWAVLLQFPNRVTVGGEFLNSEFQVRPGLVTRLSGDNGLDDVSFNRPEVASGRVYAVAVEPVDATSPPGTITIGGDFWLVGGFLNLNFAQLSSGGRTSARAETGVHGKVFTAVAIQPANACYIGGEFSSVGGILFRGFWFPFFTQNIAQLSGGRVGTYEPGADAAVFAVAVQPDGKLLVGGDFATVRGVARSRIARLISNSVDASFNPPAPVNGRVRTIAVQPDGKIVIGGDFTTVGGAVRNYVARLNPDGALDASFDPDADGPVNGIVMQPDGKIILGGNFTTVGGAVRKRAARLNPDGSVDASFRDPGANGVVNAVAVQQDGKIVIGGDFTRAGGAARNRIARLNPDGALNAIFNASVDAAVFAIAVQQDGGIIIGGEFSRVDTLPRFGLARLLPTPTVLLSSSARPSAAGQAVTFTAAVVPQPASLSTPTGYVNFMEGGRLLLTVHLDTSGRASTTLTLAAGVHDITAAYLGDQNFAPQVATLSQRVEGSALRISAADYSIREGVGRIVVTVLRSGVLSEAAAVDFETSDATASSRSDYTPAAGTLRFAPGETSKTFNVFVTDDSLVEGDETLTVALSNPTGGFSLVEPSTATLTLNDDDALPQAPNPIADTSFFVRQHYLDFLNREPDAAGRAFWTQEIEQCGADLRCREVKRINVSAAFFLSIEFQETGFFVYRLDKVAFGNISAVKPVPLALSKFLSDTQSIGQGVVVGPEGWQQKLEANKASFADAFALRTHFLSRYPTSMTPEQYVDSLNANAGGVISQEERDSLVADLKGGVRTRAQALRAVAEHTALARREVNRAFVLMQFFGYLRRDPDSAPDADFSGYNFWLGKLNEFNGNYISAEMVKAFLDSAEYRRRFGL